MNVFKTLRIKKSWKHSFLFIASQAFIKLMKKINFQLKNLNEKFWISYWKFQFIVEFLSFRKKAGPEICGEWKFLKIEFEKWPWMTLRLVVLKSLRQEHHFDIHFYTYEKIRNSNFFCDFWPWTTLTCFTTNFLD